MLKREIYVRPGKLDTDRPSFQPTSATRQKTINLAFQGGGVHAAFAWGVLDRLLEDGGSTLREPALLPPGR